MSKREKIGMQLSFDPNEFEALFQKNKNKLGRPSTQGPNCHLSNLLSPDTICYILTSPVFMTSSTAPSISGSISGFSCAMTLPRSTKFAVAFSTAATKTWALLDLPFFFWGDLDDTSVVTCVTTGLVNNQFIRIGLGPLKKGFLSLYGAPN